MLPLKFSVREWCTFCILGQARHVASVDDVACRLAKSDLRTQIADYAKSILQTGWMLNGLAFGKLSPHLADIEFAETCQG